MKPREKKKRVFAGSIAIVVASFNAHITENLLEACLGELVRLGVAASKVAVVRVPGAFEIPVAALRLAQKKAVRAVICLGAIVKGETLHYDLVAQESTRGIQEVALKTGKPVVFEVLAADTMALCEARARKGDRDNKGASAARVAVEMIRVLSKI